MGDVARVPTRVGWMARLESVEGSIDDECAGGEGSRAMRTSDANEKTDDMNAR